MRRRCPCLHCNLCCRQATCVSSPRNRQPKDDVVAAGAAVGGGQGHHRAVQRGEIPNRQPVQPLPPAALPQVSLRYVYFLTYMLVIFMYIDINIYLPLPYLYRLLTFKLFFYLYFTVVFLLSSFLINVLFSRFPFQLFPQGPLEGCFPIYTSLGYICMQ